LLVSYPLIHMCILSIYN